MMMAISVWVFPQSITAFFYFVHDFWTEAIKFRLLGDKKGRSTEGEKKREVKATRHDSSKLYPPFSYGDNWRSTFIRLKLTFVILPPWFLESLTRKTVMHHRRWTWKVINFPVARSHIHALIRLYFCTLRPEYVHEPFSNSSDMTNGNVINCRYSHRVSFFHRARNPYLLFRVTWYLIDNDKVKKKYVYFDERLMKIGTCGISILFLQ